jgi:hypothetical protein
MWFGRLILMCACVSASSVAIGQVYKWVDENGKVHYGDQPSGQQPTRKIAVPKASAPAAEAVHRRAQTDCNSSDCGKAIANEVRTNPLASGRRSGLPRATPTTGVASDSAQKAKADCKANRGVDCDNPAVVSQWARQNTPATQQEIDRAVGERNRRKIDEQFQHNLERSRDFEGARNQAR